MVKMSKPESDFNVFVAGKTGAFKGINLNNSATVVKNLQNVQILRPENEITALSWGDDNESEILIGSVNQIVKIYDIGFKAYSTSIETKVGSGPIVGLFRVNGAVATCSASGHIKVWRYKKSEEVELYSGSSVSRMQKCFHKENVVGTGGQQNDLKLWDLNTKIKIFNAKNVKKDMLQLEVPIWITDLTFLLNSEYKVAVVTRHGQIRLYDTKAQRRPVIDINLEDQTLNTISLCNNENHVMVGSATGHLMMADLRGKGKILHHYKGAVGSIRQVTAHKTLPYAASVGLDRYLRIHHLETKKLLFQQYLKVRLNCVLMASTFGNNSENNNSTKDNEDESIECVDIESDNEYNEIFENMESIKDDDCGDPRPKKKKRNS